MKEELKDILKDSLSNKAILQSIWSYRLPIISLWIGIASRTIIEREFLGVVTTAFIAVTLLFVLWIVDCKFIKNWVKNKEGTS